ncbi:2-C-methyl-D-erythritol 2,4-cyclodiphosphate synthase [Chitinispirillales bacterium ANBcel5]|uniref:2-C-methyl-D-erythritol 2,4-cyclodiphosphate synthase n=1 Tax=Cellulosispirillum alkaliphilum TaxID=3039283 RepID=UPI002A54643C|nr:2-C-methyl-D-erythritol 2,4-cyclodiphosphate synthase [Chitinispirillales bacterium ANBcel5]
MYISSIGQDSHRFETEDVSKPLILGAIKIPQSPGLSGNSDADVVLHAITNAISGISGVNILGKVSDDLCLKEGIKDSKVYLQKALQTLENTIINHVSISIECKKPKLSDHISEMKKSVAQLLSLPVSSVGITATTGEGLTGFGKGEGIQALVILSAQKCS